MQRLNFEHPSIYSQKITDSDGNLVPIRSLSLEAFHGDTSLSIMVYDKELGADKSVTLTNPSFTLTMEIDDKTYTFVKES